MTTEVVQTGYVPRKHQYQLHMNLKRFNVLLCHRRFGKSVFSINHLIDAALSCKKPMPRFAYIAPTYGSVKRIIWDYAKEYTKNIPGVEYNEAELRIDFPHNQARIMLLSGEKPDALKGIYLDGCILDEYALQSPTVWSEAVRPTLSDRLGWCIFISTVKGRNHFYDLYEYAISGKNPEWYGENFRASETGIIPQSELESARATMSEEDYLQEYENSPDAGLVGAYFAKELAKADLENRVGLFSHDPSMQVDTYWDLGVNDCTAIWFCQSQRNQHRMIRYEEFSGMGLPDILAKIKQLPYNYGDFVLPHDAKVRDWSTGRSRVETMYSLGCRRIRIIPKVGTKMESINAARMAFAVTYFDRTNCAIGLKGLANYQKKWDAKNNVFQDTPLHNWASNCADAFQQFGMGLKAQSRSSDTDIRFADESRGIDVETEYNPFGRF